MYVFSGKLKMKNCRAAINTSFSGESLEEINLVNLMKKCEFSHKFIM